MAEITESVGMVDGLKPYPEMKDSGVPWLGQVPGGWTVQRIKILFREKDQRSRDGQGVLLSLTRAHGIVPQSTASKRIASVEDLSNYRVCNPGDLVMNRMQAWSGMFAVSAHRGLISPDYSIFEPTRTLEAKFFEYLFKTPLLVNQFAQKSRGIGTGFNRLYSPDFGAIPVAVPPAAEQAPIIKFLDHADRRIRRYIRAKQKLIALLKEEKQAIVQRAVTRGLDPNVRLKPSGVQWLGDVPEHWGVWQIGHFSRVGNGSTPSRANSAYWTGGDYPWLNSAAVNRSPIVRATQFVADLALKECHLPRVSPGSVLVAITGQGKTRGKAAVLEIESTINQHIAFLTPAPRIMSAEYLQLALSAAYGELRRISDDSGSTKGALTCASLSHFRLAVPPHDEQTAIVSAIKSDTRDLSLATTRAETEIGLCFEYRERLIADVTTGKLDVREATSRIRDSLSDTDWPDEPELERDYEITEADELTFAEAEA